MPVHVFDTNSLVWEPHQRFPAIQVQVIEERATHPDASVMRVRVAVNGEIPPHVHEKETEIIFILKGDGELTVDDRVLPLRAGAGGSVFPGSRHGLKNSGTSELELLAIHTPPIR